MLSLAVYGSGFNHPRQLAILRYIRQCVEAPNKHTVDEELWEARPVVDILQA
jgi:hypothetical protein